MRSGLFLICNYLRWNFVANVCRRKTVKDKCCIFSISNGWPSSGYLNLDCTDVFICSQTASVHRSTSCFQVLCVAYLYRLWASMQVVKFACPPSSLDQGFRYTTLLIYRLFSIGCLSPFIQYCVFYILKAFYCIWQLSAKSRILPYEGNIIFAQCATGLNCFGLITSFTYILHQGVEPKLQYHIGPLLIITTPDFVDQAKNGFLFK